MVFTVAVRQPSPTRWPRRAVLTAGATSLAGIAAGCTWLGPGQQEPPPPDPLEPLLTDTRALAGRYARTLVAHPDLTKRLAPLRAAHLAHAAALRDEIGGAEPTTVPPGNTFPAAIASPVGVSDVPADPEDALSSLREQEESAREAAREACLQAPVERTGLLGSICAARASHLEVLA